MGVGVGFAALIVSLINAATALLAGYVAYRDYRKAGGDDESDTPQRGHVRGGVRSGRVRDRRSVRDKGKFRRIISAYRAGDAIPVMYTW